MTSSAFYRDEDEEEDDDEEVDEEMVSESIPMSGFSNKRSSRRSTNSQMQCERDYYKYGIIKFRGFGKLLTSNNPKFIRVDHEEIDFEKIWKTLMGPFGIDCPKLVISINGGAKKMKAMSQKLQIALKKGLLKISTTANTWLITSGLNVGVSKLVGDAMREYSLSTTGEYSPVIIGIATWGSIYNRRQLEKSNSSFSAKSDNVYFYHNCRYTGKGQAMLDPNHTHFILYDDKSEKTYNKEIGFRTELEKHFAERTKMNICSVPVVQVVIEGGKKTIETTFSTFEKGTPTILIKGSGRCADLMCELMEGTNEQSEENVISKKIDELLSEYRTPWNITDSEFSSYKRQLLEMCQKGRKLLYVFSVDGVDQELDYAILRAVIQNSSLSCTAQLSLAMDMDRCDVAKALFSKGDWEIPEKEIKDKLVIALKEGQTEFVELFLDCGTCIEEFLTRDILVELYEHASVCSKGVDLSPMIDEVKTRWYGFGASHDGNKDLLFLIGRVISRCTGDLMCNPYSFGETSDKKGNRGSTPYPPRSRCDKRLYTEQDLFLWALLLNRMDLVEIFWRMGKDHIGAALIACGILRRMCRKAIYDCEMELSKRLHEHAIYYEKLAYDILSKAYEGDKERTHDLLIRGLPYYGDETLLSLGDQNKCLKFMSHSAVQTKMGMVWMGKMNPQTPTWKIMLNLCFSLFFIRLIFPENRQENDDKKKCGISTSCTQGRPLVRRSISMQRKIDRKKQSWEDVGYFRAIYLFYNAPFTKFLLGTALNMVFLLLMSYMTMVDLRPYNRSNETDETESNASADDACNCDLFGLRRCISVMEFVIWIWVFTLVVEEIRQIFAHEQHTFYYKLKDWWSSGWNRFDFIIYILFVIAIIMRLVLPMEDFQYNRYMYVVIMALFFMRFMQTYYANRILGPKVVMISKMMNDIAFFLMIFIIFLMAYGTAAQALLYPNSKLDWNLIKNVFYQPYFQVYGELNLEEPEGKNPGATKASLVVVLFAIYLLFTNILMLSLLIAMFGYTFEKMQDISENIWAYKRHDLIFEYVDRPFLPPPLIIFPIIYRLIRYALTHRSSSKTKSGTRNYDKRSARKRKLSRKENRKMSAFEQKCMELVWTDRKHAKKSCPQDKVKIRPLSELDESRETDD